MNYLFRPTPVVVMGRDLGEDVVTLSKPPAGVMAGTPGRSGRPSRSLATQGAPWIVRSGTMASFGTLGQDFSSPIDLSTTIDIPPLIDIPDAGYGFDYSLLPPNTPIEALPVMPIAPPDIFSPGIPGALPPYLPVPYAAPPIATVPSGAGPTGKSIPGTQPVNPLPAVQAGTNLLQTLANFFKPTTAAASTVRLPGVGVNPRQPAPSFWTTSSIVPGTPNSTVVLGGAAIVILLFVLMSGGKK